MGELILMNLCRPALGMQFFRHSVELMFTELSIEYKLLSLTHKVLTTSQPTYLFTLVTVQSPRSTRSSSVVTISRPPTFSSLKITNRSFQHAEPLNWKKNSLILSVSLIHILVFHLLTALHTSDPHCHHHHFPHQSLLFFILDLKHTSSSSLFHHRLLHRYSLD